MVLHPEIILLLYALAVFLSSFLLFLVQPIIAKQIVPWFGGSASVWSACLTFFQMVLLAGYAYSDLIQRLRPPSPDEPSCRPSDPKPREPAHPRKRCLETVW